MEPSLPSPHAVPEMEAHLLVNEHDPTAPFLWDWDDLLVLAEDDHFSLSCDATTFDSNPTLSPTETTTTTTEVPDRVRKRDPRLTCSNFLAGRVPCACPEIDEKLALEEEEGVLPGKKRVRVTRTGSGAARCQVPGCEADISELKGYHKRHRVCLHCANASTVVLDGDTKRYCQQCGKFHVLSDFDEGKRSCRMKLERHNKIRRRKQPLDSGKSGVEKESQGDLRLQAEETVCDVEGRKGEAVVREALIELEDGPALTDPNSQTHNSDSGETQTHTGKDDSKFSFSPSHCDNKSAYSSMCPTGRISFKLYDWNPAEFPRRLRHQIFQWLASMPVELEGYIRPGCTILTAFIAMPTFMWTKLFEDPLLRFHDLLSCGKILSKKGPMLVYLNNMIFHVMKDGSSIMNVNVKEQAPRLHYVHPICFEAGKPIQILACGSNLLQPKFRFLVSFAGKYLAQDYCVALPGPHAEGGSSIDHQLYKIFISHIEPNIFGPAFIEVENESGLSNFIPVLIGDEEICSEMKIIQQKFDASHFPIGSRCEVSTLRQKAFSEFVVEIAWLLKDPSSENFQQIMTSSQIRRFISILEFLLLNESTTILDKILRKMKIVMDKMEKNGVVKGGSSDVEMSLLLKKMDYASNILCQKNLKSEVLVLPSENTWHESDCLPGSCSGSDVPSVSITSEDLEEQSNDKLGAIASSPSIFSSEKVRLLNAEFVIKERPRKSCSPIVSYRVVKSHPTVFVIAVLAFCFGVCAVLLHPQKVSKFAVSIRRCLTDKF